MMYLCLMARREITRMAIYPEIVSSFQLWSLKEPHKCASVPERSPQDRWGETLYKVVG